MKNYTIRINIHEQWAQTSIQDLFRTTLHAPKKLIHELRMEKAVFLNGSQVNWTSKVAANDELLILLPEDCNDSVIPAYESLQVLFEDEHLLIVNKPAGITTHPNEMNETNTLANLVAGYLQKKDDHRKIKHVQRLDKDTSGALLFAKHSLSHAILDRMLHDHQIERIYVALADGLIQESRFTVNQPIGRDRYHPTKRRVSKSGQQAKTDFQVCNTYPNKQLTLVECKLHTGRTHQIRVHLSHIGHPLAGDRLYGGRPIFPRQALHARKLAFIHPFTLEKLEITAPFLDEPSIFEARL
ncbi:RluA family pseudouridine synthase [Bacillus sp. FJAT-50079]|uniref:RluA family pseudouridine synthase n=1 Tax=Bacillus sp. FJAT-50079 TaxID=2833577 RepID=UPI0020160AF5|nr:RluA family pseudouridine synthase [Bacillus sp. FJAT-50079]